MADGRLFHARDAATGKARSPRVDRCTDGTTSVMVVEERRCRLDDLPRRVSDERTLSARWPCYLFIYFYLLWNSYSRVNI